VSKKLHDSFYIFDIIKVLQYLINNICVIFGRRVFSTDSINILTPTVLLDLAFTQEKRKDAKMLAFTEYFKVLTSIHLKVK
jgi:hypothetical protein